MIAVTTKSKKRKAINKIVMSRIESSADEEFCNAEVFSGAESSGASNDSPYREQNQCDESGETMPLMKRNVIMQSLTLIVKKVIL